MTDLETQRATSSVSLSESTSAIKSSANRVMPVSIVGAFIWQDGLMRDLDALVPIFTILETVGR
jgi:hypothetical protein